MARLVAWLMILRHAGYFHTRQPTLHYADAQTTIAKLEALPQNEALPIILYRKFTADPIPTFKAPLVRAYRPGSGFDLQFLFRRSPLSIETLGADSDYFIWSPNDKDIQAYPEATKVTDQLTRWLRGDRGWTKGPKPDIKLHDFLTGFTPEWKRKPSTPETLERA